MCVYVCVCMCVYVYVCDLPFLVWKCLICFDFSVGGSMCVYVCMYAYIYEYMGWDGMGWDGFIHKYS